jgi:surfactin synthase thioesterase subunit
MKTNLGRLSLVLLGCSLGALLAFRLIGSHVDGQGVLREPFFLMPISALLAGAGAATGITATV